MDGILILVVVGIVGSILVSAFAEEFAKKRRAQLQSWRLIAQRSALTDIADERFEAIAGRAPPSRRPVAVQVSPDRLAVVTKTTGNSRDRPTTRRQRTDLPVLVERKHERSTPLGYGPPHQRPPPHPRLTSTSPLTKALRPRSPTDAMIRRRRIEQLPPSQPRPKPPPSDEQEQSIPNGPARRLARSGCAVLLQPTPIHARRRLAAATPALGSADPVHEPSQHLGQHRCRQGGSVDLTV